MKQIEIREIDYEDSPEGHAAVHADLAEQLGFPAYYGANLDALNDCLEELDGPVEVTLARRSEEAFLRYENLIAGGEGEWAWFDKLCRCFERATRNNDELEVVFTHEPTCSDGSDGAGVLPDFGYGDSGFEDADYWDGGE